MGRDRELKRALERHWRDDITADVLLDVADTVRRDRWHTMEAAGLDEIPVGDFSLYDHMLDTTCLLGAVPTRFIDAVQDVSHSAGRLARYFAMARGADAVAPLEMTKWFDTNYHYLVPELGPGTEFGLHSSVLVDELRAARTAVAVPLRPVIVGPATFLSLAKAGSTAGPGFDPWSLLDRLIPVYGELLRLLQAEGVDWVQLDEPVLVTDLDPDRLRDVDQAYRSLASGSERPQLLVGTYFGHLGEAAAMVAALPVDGIALDLTESGAANLALLGNHPGLRTKRVVAGVVSGRNVWRSDLDVSVAAVQQLQQQAVQVDVAPSCSLLHVPHDVDREQQLDPEVRSWLAFADQKLREVVVVARAAGPNSDDVLPELADSRAVLAARRSSPLVHDPVVAARAAEVTEDELRRTEPYQARVLAQRERLGLPELPTTTIGSFPQTDELRRARSAVRRGDIDQATYDDAIRGEIDRVLALQERLGLDLLVHGEPERNDMVQYVAELLDGVWSTQHGWVQSYGSRCVRPPIIAGDVSRPAPMTVAWSRYAQGRTARPVKGMLTGPVTMLAWSFVRDDQPLSLTARQMALALRDEVVDLEAAGIAAIQVDEPALRETLPLRLADHPAYLAWAVDAFRLTTAGVRADTQIHTHMCYAEFGDITYAIVALDADVISLEATRSHLETVTELAAIDYPREVGPGVWDIHSPRIPTIVEISDTLTVTLERLDRTQIWVNPDCGLKTRGYAEVEAALGNMVAAAREVREHATS